jgi:hypothetical protein
MFYILPTVSRLNLLVKQLYDYQLGINPFRGIWPDAFLLKELRELYSDFAPLPQTRHELTQHKISPSVSRNYFIFSKSQ